LQITALTIDNDTQALFDFEASSVSKQTFTTRASVRVFSQDNEIQVVEASEAEGPLVQVNRKTGFFMVEAGPPQKHPASQEQIWMVLKMLQVPGSHRGYRLSEGDVVRMGRAELRVVELQYAGQDSFNKGGPVLSSQLFRGSLNARRREKRWMGVNPTLPQSEGEEMGEEPSSSQCRVCYSESYTMEDPLVSICKCAGSLQFLHISCLRFWIASRVEVRERGPVRSYEWKRLECELCKSPYPVKVQLDSYTYELVSFPRPHEHYIVLEESSSKEDNSYTCLYIHLTKSQVRCGRSHDCPVRVKDITVSRSHATLYLSNKGAYIEDNESKFGTLVLVNRAIVMQLRTEVALQVGKVVLVFKLRKAWSFWDCLGSCHRPASPEFSLESDRPETPQVSINQDRERL
jgi:hypothetical protein